MTGYSNRKLTYVIYTRMGAENTSYNILQGIVRLEARLFGSKYCGHWLGNSVLVAISTKFWNCFDLVSMGAHQILSTTAAEGLRKNTCNTKHAGRSLHKVVLPHNSDEFACKGVILSLLPNIAIPLDMPVYFWWEWCIQVCGNKQKR